MGENRVSQGIQYGIGHISSTTTRFMFSDRRSQLSQLRKEEVFVSLVKELLMFEIFGPSTSRSARSACLAAKKTKNERENC